MVNRLDQKDDPLILFCRTRPYRTVLYVGCPTPLRSLPPGGIMLVNDAVLAAEDLPWSIQEGDTLRWIPGVEA